MKSTMLHHTPLVRILAALVVCANAWSFQREQPPTGFSSHNPPLTIGNLGEHLLFQSVDSPVERLKSKLQLIRQLAPAWARKGGDRALLQSMMEKISGYGDSHQIAKAEEAADEVLAMLGARDTPLPDVSGQLHRAERESLLASAKTLNLSGIEDYIGWAAVEPEQGKPNWDVYREDATAIRKAGISFVPYLWVQALPAWAKADPKYVYAGNVATGLATGALSIFAPETLAAYDRLFGQAKREIGTYTDILRIGSPYDFGETAYPAGAASFAFPMKNLESGFWVNEAPARAHFKASMRSKYPSIQALNAAWGTTFSAFESLDYPKDNTHPRFWLDFILWYHQAFTGRMGMIVELAQKHFPGTPININIGWPYEKINLGQDISGLLKMAGGRHIYVRTPTGASVPFLYTKRVATAARHYAPASFSSEPVDGNAPCRQIALAYFKDLTTGVKWHFDYGPNFDRCPQALADYRAVWRDAEYPKVDTALFFPTTAHYLDDWNNWNGSGFNGGFPEGLQQYAEDLRDMLDYDVVDERLVSDGFLDAYRVLIWPAGDVVESATARKVKTWVENGGTLLIADRKRIQTVEGAPAFEDLPAGKGKVIEIGKDVRDLESRFPGKLDARDGVLVSTFSGAILLFNGTGKTVVKTIPAAQGAAEITLSPLQFKLYKIP
jgi:hypothetical protein